MEETKDELVKKIDKCRAVLKSLHRKEQATYEDVIVARAVYRLGLAVAKKIKENFTSVKDDQIPATIDAIKSFEKAIKWCDEVLEEAGIEIRI